MSSASLGQDNGHDIGEKGLPVATVVTYEMHTNFRETFHIRSDSKQYNAAYPNADARSIPIDSWWEKMAKCKRLST